MISAPTAKGDVMMELICDRQALKDEGTQTEIAGINPMIFVSGAKDKPYFHIKYFDTSDQCYHIGFGSYNLSFVFDWLKEYFGCERASLNETETVRHGWWKFKPPNGWACSACGEWGLMLDNRGICKSNFCPNCGADMRGDGHAQ